MTETWMSVGESSSFSEVLLLDCICFSSPRSTGRGGVVATSFREQFNCRHWIDFIQWCDLSSTLKDFIDDFSVFFAWNYAKI